MVIERVSVMSETLNEIFPFVDGSPRCREWASYTMFQQTRRREL